MKKTITINLGGTVFNIEEDAYEKLRSYLDSVKSHFADEEIVSDIEGRMAELFAEKSGESKIVTMTLVEEMVKSMGRVEDFGGEIKGETEPKQIRRLFRDGDDKIIAGVASGLAHY